ncbi:MAG TPA: NADH-quinone oxidoreductase subunit M [Tepidisphaeraceae bacterium]|nr:NADH-quinone oxidoreductase subunit M [Tepidisphaeraceae bacterium]
MPNDYGLLVLLLIPLVGAVGAALMPDGRTARRWALLVSLATFAFGVYLAVAFNFAQPERLQFVHNGAAYGFAVGDIGFAFNLGLDSISLWLVLLTVLLMPLAIAASFGSIRERQKEYYAWMLALTVAMLGVFVARDVLLFYVFFELTLVPMFFIIGIWGGPERRYAAGKFFLFTFTGSVFTLAAAIYVGLKAGSFDIADAVRVAQTQLSHDERFWVLLGFIAGFAVKVPLFPVHTWLPLAHTEAPTAGSVILAGVLLKLGTYGLLRLAVPIGLVGDGRSPQFPMLVAVIGVLCVIGILYGALVAWVQQDIKKLVAYSSVSHLGFCVLGMIALNDIGMQGSVLYMVNHGLSTGAMFLVIGMIYDRFHTRDIDALSGLAARMPKMAFFFVLFVLSSIGLPGLNGFVSEFLTILGAFTSEHLGYSYGAFAALGIILGALYMLHMTARVIWGPLKYPHGHGEGHGHAHQPLPRAAAAYDAHGAESHPVDGTRDLTGRELAVLAPLAVAVVLLGVMPTPVLDSMLRPIQAIRTPASAMQQPERRLVENFPPSHGTPGEGRGEGSLLAVVEKPSP